MSQIHHSFDSIIYLSPSSSENTRSSKAMIADGSEQIQPYHPYPLKHIGGPYYVGPPILGIHDPDVELKFGKRTKKNLFLLYYLDQTLID